jgi:hypothetical protein
MKQFGMPFPGNGCAENHQNGCFASIKDYLGAIRFEGENWEAGVGGLGDEAMVRRLGEPIGWIELCCFFIVYI